MPLQLCIVTPAAGRVAYVSATKRLIQLARQDKGLLHKENIANGFHRNMLGMKPAGLCTSLIGSGYGLVLTKVLRLKPLGIEPTNFAEPGLPGAVTLLISGAMLLAWVFYFDANTVKTKGFAYGERLFEHLPKLKTASKSRPS